MKNLFRYFMARKKFWLIPLLAIFALAAILVIAGPSNPYSPFIYTVF
jgi:hypothetical protein